MIPENRQERFTAYAATLRERFQTGLLSELHGLPQWVVWRAEGDREGKKKKVPYTPRSHLVHASVKVPQSWGSLDQALKALESGNYSGIGFMLTPPLVFIDREDKTERKTGQTTYLDMTIRNALRKRRNPPMRR